MSTITCLKCDGLGQIRMPQVTPHIYHIEACIYCKGHGKIMGVHIEDGKWFVYDENWPKYYQHEEHEYN